MEHMEGNISYPYLPPPTPTPTHPLPLPASEQFLQGQGAQVPWTYILMLDYISRR